MKVGIVGLVWPGLTATIAFARRGFEVTPIGQGIKNSNSYLAQVGIAFPVLDTITSMTRRGSGWFSITATRAAT